LVQVLWVVLLSDLNGVPLLFSDSHMVVCKIQRAQEIGGEVFDTLGMSAKINRKWWSVGMIHRNDWRKEMIWWLWFMKNGDKKKQCGHLMRVNNDPNWYKIMRSQ